VPDPHDPHPERPHTTGGPYRDVREVLLAKRRRLQQEMSAAAQAVEQLKDLRKDLSVVEETLRKETVSLLETVRITTPCRERWEEMVGDDVVRHCGRCDRDVHDLSAMTKAEAEAFLAQNGNACIRLRRRKDGRLVTADCPPPPWTRKRMQAGALALAAATGATYAATRPALDVSPLEAPTVEPEKITYAQMGDFQSPPLHADTEPYEAPYALRIVEARSLTNPRRPRLVQVARGVRVRRPQDTLLGEMGVEHGDTLLATEGEPISSRADVEALLATLASQRRVRFDLLRRGEEVRLDVLLRW
jgi:hypothetical protein